MKIINDHKSKYFYITQKIYFINIYVLCEVYN
jgi:hypothetical protein